MYTYQTWGAPVVPPSSFFTGHLGWRCGFCWADRWAPGGSSPLEGKGMTHHCEVTKMVILNWEDDTIWVNHYYSIILYIYIFTYIYIDLQICIYIYICICICFIYIHTYIYNMIHDPWKTLAFSLFERFRGSQKIFCGYFRWHDVSCGKSRLQVKQQQSIHVLGAGQSSKNSWSELM